MRRVFNIVAALLVVALVIGLYKAKTDAARARAHVNELNHQVEDAEADVRALRAEIAEQESPAHVEELAKETFGPRPRVEPAPQSAIDQELPPPREDARAKQAHP